MLVFLFLLSPLLFLLFYLSSSSVVTRASISSGWYFLFAAALFLLLLWGLLLLFLLGYCGLVCCGSAGAAGRASWRFSVGLGVSGAGGRGGVLYRLASTVRWLIRLL